MKVFGIQNEKGHWYTGQLRNGRPVFSSDKDDAIEMEEQEVTEEIEVMPAGCKSVVLHEYR